MGSQDDDSSRNLRPPAAQIYHPAPRPHRSSPGFSLTPLSTKSSTPPDTSDESLKAPASEDPSEAAPDLPAYVSARLNQSKTPQSMADNSQVSPKNTNGSVTPPHKSRSILNLTSSTLFGIYSTTGYDANRDEPETPWGTGAQTPSLQRSASGVHEKSKQLPQNPDVLTDKAMPSNQSPMFANITGQYRRIGRPQSRWRSFLSLAARVIALFILGVSYCTVVTHLHDKRNIAPVKVRINRGTWFYMSFWGSLSVFLGFLLPWMDRQWPGADSEDVSQPVESPTSFSGEERRRLSRRNTDSSGISQVEDSPAEQAGAEWNPIVRSVGAFVGIAFAIRRLPWQSTLQVSLTLALVNPVLWYLLDRTKTGFLLSLITGITGATVMMSLNPNIVPTPGSPLSSSFLSSTSPTSASSRPSSSAASSPPKWPGLDSAASLGLLSVEKFLTLEGIGVATWILSVFFCSCVCFGNVGRRFVYSDF